MVYKRPDVLRIECLRTIFVQRPESTIYRPSLDLGNDRTRTCIIFSSQNGIRPCTKSFGNNISKASTAIKEGYDAEGRSVLGDVFGQGKGCETLQELGTNKLFL